jgi:glycine C-acetyltransferase
MDQSAFLQYLRDETAKLRETGLYKAERVIRSPQQASIETVGADGQSRKVLNLCANNYLGLANHPELIEAAREALRRYGFGLSSVRFICGTQTVHKELEAKLSQFLGTEDTILYSSCFDANTGLFETILGPDDAVISDALNHASIIDGVRLCKAQRLRYANNDMANLERQLQAAKDCRFRLIATDGVFSMDGILANLPAICDLADKYQALVMVDDSHAVGFMGPGGRGTHEHHGVMGRIDILTGTLGKALGGASGGYTSGRKEIVEWLRQRSRPYLFSNTLAPAITATSIKVIEMLRGGGRESFSCGGNVGNANSSSHEKDSRPLLGEDLRQRLRDNAAFFRGEMQKLGFRLVPGEHPIIPVMLGEAGLAKQVADALLEEGVYVIGFSYPVVPQGQARIRTQMSAAHSREDLAKAVAAFAKVGRALGVVKA